MTEPTGKADAPLKSAVKSRDTVEAYRSLVETEIRNILERMGTLASTQDDLLFNVNDLALKIEEVVSTMERLETSREFFREELEDLKRQTEKNEAFSKALFKRMKELQDRLNSIDSSSQ
jgi:chromosome segregation ATPase